MADAQGGCGSVDTVSRDAAALLERLVQEVRRLPGTAVFREYTAICNWLSESNDIVDFADMANGYVRRSGSITGRQMARRICER
jgi:hypothetical protein